MKHRKQLTCVVMAAFAAVVAGVIASSASAVGGRSCPWSGLQCPDVYNPVTCSNGVTYPNACYARRACATGCGAPGS